MACNGLPGGMFPYAREVLGELALDSVPVIRQALITVPKPADWTTR